ncbi:MAG: pentapeptide repeat-containing protein [Acidimicrobiales bacterium]
MTEVRPADEETADASRWLSTLPRLRRGREQRRQLSMAELPGVDLFKADLGSSDLRNKDLTGARLVEADLTGADLAGAILIKARFHRADLSRADLTGADCEDANFFRAVLAGAVLDRVSANDTSFEEADMRGASLVGADLSRSQLDGADLRRADLTNASIGARALTRAITDSTTTLPDGAPAPDGGLTPPSRPVRTAAKTVEWSRFVSPKFLRTTLISLGATLVVVGAMSSTEFPIGGIGAGISADLSGDAQGLPSRGFGDDRPRRASSTAIRDMDASLTTREQPATDRGEEPDTGVASAVGAFGESIDSGGGFGAVQSAATLTPAETESESEADSETDTDSTADTSAAEVDAEASAASSDEDEDVADPDPAPETEQGESNPEPEPVETTSPLVEVPAVGAAAQLGPGVTGSPPSATGSAVARTVEVVLTSTGQSSTATIRSALGAGELDVDEARSFELQAAPGGPVAVDLVPSDDTTVASCAILVDGVERSFRRGFAGEPVTCQIDLG